MLGFDFRASRSGEEGQQVGLQRGNRLAIDSLVGHASEARSDPVDYLVVNQGVIYHIDRGGHLFDQSFVRHAGYSSDSADDLAKLA